MHTAFSLLRRSPVSDTFKYKQVSRDKTQLDQFDHLQAWQQLVGARLAW